MATTNPENETALKEELRELAEKNRWYIENRWGVEEQQADAKRVADQLLALTTGEAMEPVPSTEQPQPDLSDIKFEGTFAPPDWLVEGDDFPIVGRKFSKPEFIEYVKWVKQNEPYLWEPSGITMHHTGYPDLSIRPNGFTEQHMRNMRHGYLNNNGWHHGPHVYTDDHGIWVFNPLSRRGVHAVSFNSTRYGIEMLGNFDTEADYSNPRGVVSRDHGMFAVAVLMKHAGISTAKLNFHRHDRETRKTCPGKYVNFSEFEEAVLAMVERV
jgi:hypothetical protein